MENQFVNDIDDNIDVNVDDNINEKINVLPNFDVDIIELILFTDEIQKYILLNLMKYTKLKEFHCSFCNLGYLPDLPDTLIGLYCSNNNLTELPKVLPSSLHILLCEDNNLTEISNLPNSLKYLYLRNNKISHLDNLPDSLILLNCSHNNLTKLPKLPNLLNHLSCDNNHFIKLDTFLPNSLSYLSCSSNKLIELPEILPNNLYHLICYNNELTELPDLPDSLNVIIIFHNKLIYKDNTLKTIREFQNIKRNVKKLNLLNRTLLLEWSARISLNPKRIERLLSSDQINFYDGSFGEI